MENVHKSSYVFTEPKTVTMNLTEFQEIYDQYGGMILRRSHYLLGNEQEALDATQEIFCKIYQNFGEFRGDASIKTWIFRVTTNYCLNRIRWRQVRRGEAQETLKQTELAKPQTGTAEQMERTTMLKKVMAHVDEQTRQIIVYYYFDDMTLNQVSEMVEISIPTLRKRIEAFLTKAKKILEN
jgi:RNA polymerase sigma factor (sigma-70 family)